MAVTTLLTHTPVLCFDASQIFTGKNVAYRFDIKYLGTKACPVYNEEFQTNDFVLVLHSYYPTSRKGVDVLGLGIYAAVLIAHAGGV